MPQVATSCYTDTQTENKSELITNSCGRAKEFRTRSKISCSNFRWYRCELTTIGNIFQPLEPLGRRSIDTFRNAPIRTLQTSESIDCADSTVLPNQQMRFERCKIRLFIAIWPGSRRRFCQHEPFSDDPSVIIFGSYSDDPNVLLVVRSRMDTSARTRKSWSNLFRWTRLEKGSPQLTDESSTALLLCYKV